MSSTSNQPAPPTKEQVLERIEAQRLRLRERKARRTQIVAESREANRVAGLGPDAPLVSRVAVFARLHPVACAFAAAVAVVVGPRKLIRWTGLALPLLMKMRGR